MKLLIATRNRDKLREIGAVFAESHLELVSARDWPGLSEVEEDGDTLEANAAKKAVECARATGLWALADDTGLEVAALDGRPGVYAARYAGENATYADNCMKVLDELAGVADRQARFRTVIALSSPAGRVQWVAGVCEGVITEDCRGEGGFGYDPVFVPEGHVQTFAELSLEEKNRISHRGRALRKAREAWGALLASNPPEWP